MLAKRAQTVLVLTDPMTCAHRGRLANFAVKHGLPLMGGVTGYAEAGSLLSYWADGTDLVRRAASFRLTMPPSLLQRANLVIE